MTKKIIARSTVSRGRLPLLFRVTVMVARLVRVDGMFIARARDILTQEQSPAKALRFLSCYIRLKLGMAIPGFSYNLPAQLNSEEEKTKTLEILRSALAAAKKAPSRQSLELQIFRLQNAQPADPDVRAYISRLMREGIDQKHSSSTTQGGDRKLKTAGRETLVSIKNIFSKKHKRFFLISGTLLGAVRDKGFVNNDIDIDLGVFVDEVSPQDVREMMHGSDFFLKEDFEYKLGYQSPDGVDLEFFFLHRLKDKVLIRGFGGIIEWHFSPFELKTHIFLGEDFLIPADTDLYLAENYVTWRQRPAFYNYIFDTPCHRIGDNSEAMVYLSMSLGSAFRTKNRFEAKKIAEILNNQFGIDYLDQFPDKR